MRGVGGGIPLTREEAKEPLAGVALRPWQTTSQGRTRRRRCVAARAARRPSFTQKALSRIRATHSSQMVSRPGGHAEQMAFQTTLTMGS